MFLADQFEISKQRAGCYLASSVSIALCALGAWIQPAQAEGSRDMFPSGAPGNRGHIVWRNGTSAGFKNRTLFRVYAEQGEHILVGSTTVGVGSGNIQIFDPDRVTGTAANESLPATADFTCTDQSGRGFISSRAEELAGPESINGSGNVAGYRPCFYKAPTTGIYYVAIYGPSGSNSNTNTNTIQSNIEAVNTGTNQTTGISAWDVTVRSNSLDSVDDLEGRLHTFFMSINMGNNGRQLHSDLYPITADGYRYEIDMRGLDPFGFRIFGNQLGNLDSDGASPLYRDVLGTNGDIANPVGGTSSAPPQFPIFFNEIDSSVLPFLPVYNPITGVEEGVGFSPIPIFPVASNSSFTGDVVGNTSTVNTGGTFSFDSNLPGVYQIVISRDGVDFDPGNSQNKVLRGVMSSSGTQTVDWNGQDNSSVPFPVGSFEYGIEIHGGEYHFPMSDAENNIFGGPTYTLLNSTNPLGNTTAFYDHRGYFTLNGTLVEDRNPGDGDPTDDALCGTNPPDPPATNLFTGADSSSGSFNVFGVPSGGNTNEQCTGAFGDTKTLDLWTYTPSEVEEGDVVIIDSADYGDAPDTGAGSGAGNYRTLASDGGPLHGTDSTLFLGGGVTDDSDGFGNGTDSNGDATDDVDDAFASLSGAIANTSYPLNNIPINNTTGADAILHAWIDFDQNGEFEEGEYQSATVASGDTTASLSWDVPVSAMGGTTYARFRLTTDSLSDDVNTAEVDERSLGAASDGEVEDYQLVITPATAEVLMVKRITAVNGAAINPNDGTDLSQFEDDTGSPQAADDNHPNWPADYLVGAVDAGGVQPNDEIEYTVYFLNSGGVAVTDVRLCDRLFPDQLFVTDAYGPGVDVQLQLGTSPVLGLTAADDGSDRTQLIAATAPVDATCNLQEPNDNGTLIIDLTGASGTGEPTLTQFPGSTGPGTPNDAYGFFRFKTRVTP